MKHKLILTTSFFILLHLLSMQPLLAQNSRTLTLKEAIDLTIANSKTLKIDKTKVAEAVAAITEASARRLPDVGISGAFLFLPVNPGLELKTGGNNNGGNPPRVWEAAYGIASVSLPVYSAGKIKYAIESAKFVEQAVKLDADNERSLVILNSINACINLYKAHQAIALVKENLEQSQQRVNDLVVSMAILRGPLPRRMPRPTEN